MRAGPIRMLAGLHPFALNPASWGGMVNHGLASKRLRADRERACCSVPTEYIRAVAPLVSDHITSSVARMLG
jgi:hypothetical protein